MGEKGAIDSLSVHGKANRLGLVLRFLTRPFGELRPRERGVIFECGEWVLSIHT